MESPYLTDLYSVVETPDPNEPGVTSLTAWAVDGSSVVLTWDEVANSAQILWIQGDEARVTIAREAVSKISVHEQDGRVEMRIWAGTDDWGGPLTVSVAERITISDALLWR